MARILITLFAVLLAVVYHSKADPSLTVGQNPYPLPTESISAACNAVLNDAITTCNQTGNAAVYKSGITKEIMDANEKGDLSKAHQLKDKANCCFLWTQIECTDTESMNKCDSKDYIMAHAKSENRRHSIAIGACKKYPETLKCK